MTDGQSLLLLFVALYFIECLRWLPPRSLLLTGSGERWSGRRPFQPVKLAGRCPVLLGLLPPQQAHLITLSWQLIPAEAGLEMHLDDRRPLLLPWEQVKPVADGRTLHLSPQMQVRWPLETQAAHACQQVRQWLAMTHQEREADFLEHARRTLEAAPLTAQAADLTSRTHWLRHLGSFIFIWTFGVLVVLYRWLGDGQEVLWAAAALLALQLSQAVLFFRQARTLPHRFWKALMVALLPQHAMRATDLLCDVPSPVPAHPLAGRPLIGDEAWKKIACQMWKKARFQPSATTRLQCLVLETWLEKEGLPISEIEAPPQQQTGSALYCPSCQSQFKDGTQTCLDCGGIPLRPFASV
ncbi:hypothetical protein WJU23_13915 [Prosthecobacter sp. SYSU 5D2]|uniref:hypothetical protein n=1 Tax=Prosthecobacter sp. SYSU 5D2 TaxID=3134134 RepID=UPI0031FED379